MKNRVVFTIIALLTITSLSFGATPAKVLYFYPGDWDHASHDPMTYGECWTGTAIPLGSEDVVYPFIEGVEYGPYDFNDWGGLDGYFTMDYYAGGGVGVEGDVTYLEVRYEGCTYRTREFILGPGANDIGLYEADWVYCFCPIVNVRLISLGPPDWGYRLNWLGNDVSRLVFTDICEEAEGSVSGDAAADWTVTDYADSVVFETLTPLTSGSIDTFWLSSPCCTAGFITWDTGDTLGIIRGPFATFSNAVSGPLYGTIGPGIILVCGDISVGVNDTLTLSSGTTFLFTGPFGFNIYGTLLAEGTESDGIHFTTDTLANPERWRGLLFSGSDCSNSSLSFCTIQYTHQRAGILCVASASPTFTNCNIIDNIGGYNGGGLGCGNGTAPSFTNCMFSRNLATVGGGVHCNDASPTFTNCIINGNAARYGGGVDCDANAQPVFRNCTISGNLLHGSPPIFAGVYIDESSPIFTRAYLKNICLLT